MNKKRLVPIKNYLLAVILFLGVIFLFVYAFMWYNIKKEEKLLESYLITTNTTSLILQELDEVDAIFEEAPDNFFLFISYTKDKDVLDLEKEIKPYIDKYNVNDIFYYLDVTDLKENSEFLNNLNKKLNTQIKYLPTLIYFSHNNIVETLESSDKETLKKDNFKTLLEIYFTLDLYE